MCLARSRSNLSNLPHGLDFGFGPARARQRVASAQHGHLDIIGQDGSVAAEVFTNGLDLLGDPHQELKISLQVRRTAGERRPLSALYPLQTKWYTKTRRSPSGPMKPFLSVPVNTAIALLQAVRVPRDFVVDEPIAVVLKVQSFCGSIRGEENAHWTDFRGGLKRRFDLFPRMQVHPAIHGHQPVTACESVLGENFHEPVLCRPVFGEDDDPFAGSTACQAEYTC